MPPKIPQSLVAAITPAISLMLVLPASLCAQLGYPELQAEQGSNLSPTTGSRLVYIAEESNAWRYWTGDLGDPDSQWRLSSFVEPTGWLTGQTSVGYDDGDDNTVLSGMEDNYTSVYLRHQFTVPSGGVPSLLHLRLYVDDGAIVWLNGIEIARYNVSDPNPTSTSTASATIGQATWQDFFIPGTGDVVVEGSNTVAVHALNGNIGSSDFSIDLELARPRLDFGQVEATDPGDNFLTEASPDSSPAIGFEYSGSGLLANKTFEVRSNSGGIGFGTSSHALNVASFSYRLANRAAYFLTHIKNWEAEGFLAGDLLNTGTTPPDPSYTQVQNHSWITTTEDHSSSELNRFIRRFDYMNSRDGILSAVGVNNLSSTTVPEVWGCSYNTISVGRIDGEHSRGGTVSGVDGEGRLKPDIVANGNGSATSYSTANVSGTAAFLLGIAYERPELSKVFHPEVNKAIMMASAIKEPGWSNSAAQPLDPIYGVGTLQVYDAYHLLVAGQHSASNSVPPSGWDYAELAPATTASYSFIVPEEKLSTRCSIVLTWFRQFEDDPAANDFATLPVVPDFDLRLFESQDGVPGTQLKLSDSAVDNVEHVYIESLLPGEYTITLSTDTLAPYALAWENRLQDQPTVEVTAIDPGAGEVSVELQNLVDGKPYILQYSDDLIAWSDLHTFTAGSETEPFTQTAIPISSRRGFYRVKWTP